MISPTERERLVMLFRKEHAGMVDPPRLGPVIHANLMVNETPAVARKWLADEGLLDGQIACADAKYVLEWLRQIDAPENIVSLQERALDYLVTLEAAPH